MKIRLWPYFLNQAFANIMNNRLVHFITLGTTTASFIILGLFLLIFFNLNLWLEGWGKSLTLSVYLEDVIENEKRESIRSFIASLPNARIDRFISKDGAFEELKKLLGPHSQFLEALDSNPLPASFEVSFQNDPPLQLDPEDIKKNLEALEGVDEVQYSKEWAGKFDHFLKMLRFLGFVMGALLCMGVLFIVTNAIKLTIYSRRDEIAILKLVGATDWFVKVPFIIEGAIHGILSALLALLILFGGYLIISAEKFQVLGLIALDFSFLPILYAFALFLLSVILGAVGSLVAVGRFFEI